MVCVVLCCVVCCVVLCCVVLCCVVLCCVVLCCVVLCCVVWCGVVWCGVVWCGVVVVWCGVVWCGVVWCGVVWCGVVWCGVVWCGWCGVVWCGVVWCGVVWCGVVWCGVVWCGVVWCGVVWCGVVWCGVVWCGVVCFTTSSSLRPEETTTTMFHLNTKDVNNSHSSLTYLSSLPSTRNVDVCSAVGLLTTLKTTSWFNSTCRAALAHVPFTCDQYIHMFFRQTPARMTAKTKTALDSHCTHENSWAFRCSQVQRSVHQS